MNKLLSCFGFWLALALVGWHVPGARGQSQQEMNAQARQDFAAADATLNRIYKQVTSKLDAEAKAKLQEVQRAWIQFRDAEAAFQADREARGGSMAPLIYEGTRGRLTKARTEELRKLLRE